MHAAGFPRSPYSGSIGMHQEKHEELQRTDQSKMCSCQDSEAGGDVVGWEGGRRGGVLSGYRG